MAEALHWTERSISEFVNRISFDFITQLAKKMESLPLKQGEFAKKLGLTSGRISQVFNNPGNLTLNKIVKYARALGLKVAIVAYDDGDRDNERGPISSEIFSICWEKAGQPQDFWSANSIGYNLLYETHTFPMQQSSMFSLLSVEMYDLAPFKYDQSTQILPNQNQ